MLKVGHRGAKGHVAENTFLSFQKAIELGVDMVELDVLLSKDKIPMVIHDSTIDRTTPHTGLVKDFSSLKLREMGIPTLEDIMQLVNTQCEINIEIKEYDATPFVLNLIEKYQKWQNQYLISSFDWNALQEIRFQSETIRLGILTETDLELALSFAKFIGAYSVHPHYHLLTTENCRQIQNKGFKIYTWTVNEPEDITFVKSLQVDGIITDFPERL